jgi:hypothetical protein
MAATEASVRLRGQSPDWLTARFACKRSCLAASLPPFNASAETVANTRRERMVAVSRGVAKCAGERNKQTLVQNLSARPHTLLFLH